jgi:hypothetical protein
MKAIGFLVVTLFTGFSTFSQTLQEAIRKINSKRACEWGKLFLLR